MDNREYIGHCKKQYSLTICNSAESKNDQFRNATKAISLSVFGLNYGTWLNECLINQNWSGLNNIIFQTIHYSLVPGLPSSTDHCIMWLPTLASFACGEYGVIEQTFPKDLGLTYNGHPFDVIMSNLIISIWYNEEKWLKNVIFTADKFLMQKRPKWQKSAVSFLIALHNNNVPVMESCLQILCDNFSYSNFSKQEKEICIPAHGLYCFAELIGTRKNGNILKMPDHNNFLKEYAYWRTENISPTNKLYFEYPSPMEILNQILLTPIAKSCLEQPYLNSNNPYLSAKDKKAWFLDENAMLTSFCQNVSF